MRFAYALQHLTTVLFTIVELANVSAQVLENNASMSNSLSNVQQISKDTSLKDSSKTAVGNCEKQEEALKLQSEMKKLGFTDAFVVVFKNNNRISLQEAQAITP